jgi:YVTN family beta-propeller protein
MFLGFSALACRRTTSGRGIFPIPCPSKSSASGGPQRRYPGSIPAGSVAPPGRTPAYAVAVAKAGGSSRETDRLAPDETARTPSDSWPAEAPIRTFLIADIRGYTRFTQEKGDEAAGRLAAAFAELSRAPVASHGGEVIELRGDEVLCVFGSARQALRAAVELQRSFRRRTDDRAAFPLPIGIGLDAGEAVPTEGGYRGGALNTASRLCSLAAPGEILATETVVSLARRLDGIRFVDRRPVRLKGLEKPVRVIEVVPEVSLPPLPEIPDEKPLLVTRRRAALAATIGLVLLGVIVLAVIRSTGEENAVPANSVAVIDPASNQVVDAIRVGESPGPIAAAGHTLWVVNLADQTLSRIDPATRTRTKTIGLRGAIRPEALPPRLAGDSDDLWVVVDCFRALLRMNPRNGLPVQTLPLSTFNEPASFHSCAVTADSDSVWVAVDSPFHLVGIDAPAAQLATVAKSFPLPVGVRTAIAVGAGSVWLADRVGIEGAAIRRINPETGDLVAKIPVDNGPEAMVFANGAVWVVNQMESSVLRIRPRTNSVVRAISVGQSPSGIAVGAGALWVTNTGSGTLSRIDPVTSTVTKTIELGHRPRGIAFFDGLVWVTVRE